MKLGKGAQLLEAIQDQHPKLMRRVLETNLHQHLASAYVTHKLCKKLISLSMKTFTHQKRQLPVVLVRGILGGRRIVHYQTSVETSCTLDLRACLYLKPSIRIYAQ